MANNRFKLADFNDVGSFGRSATTMQKGEIQVTATTSSLSPNGPNLNMTTLGLSEIMQGRALYKTQDQFLAENQQALSSSLSGLIKGKDLGKGNPQAVLGGAESLLPWDVMLIKGYQDGFYDMGGEAGTDSAPTAIDGITVAGASGLRFVNDNGLKPNAAAAKQFVMQQWGIKNIGGYSTSGHASNSDHYTGHAIDVMVSHTAAAGAEKDKGDQVAAWFCANPDVFDVKYIIWYRRIITRKLKSEGWRVYTPQGGATDPSHQHTNHVHISFRDNDMTSPGPMGNPLTTTT